VTLLSSVTNSSVYFVRELLYDWQFTANQFVLATSPFRLMASIFFFRMNICFHSFYVTSSLTRGRVYRLQLLLVLASAVILRSESHGTYDRILLFQIRDSSNLGGQYLYPPGAGCDSYTTMHWVPFSSPPTTRRMEIFCPASTWAYILCVCICMFIYRGP
jgi:hypothetical protein